MDDEWTTIPRHDGRTGLVGQLLARAFPGDHTAPMDRQKVISGFPDVAAASNDAGEAVCAHPECSEKAEFRAPKSRETLEDFYWFCLEHVREYNAGWNYFAGMDDDAIEKSVREDTVWRRPTWPLGVRTGAATFHDPLGILGAAAAVDPAKARAGEVQRRAMTGQERQAMAELGLEPPVSREDVKMRYKILAKTLHPDANGGDKRAEERLKSVNHAYKTLRDSDRLT